MAETNITLTCNTPIQNPLVKVYLSLPNPNILFTKSVYQWKKICKEIGDEVKKISKSPIDLDKEPQDLNLESGNLNDDVRWIPVVWCRIMISTSLMDDIGFHAIKEFSGGNIWEVGAGSGYNARVLELMGVNMYPTDKPSCRFLQKFTTVYQDPMHVEKARIQEIIKAEGAIMYIWTEREHHNLDIWLRLGGKKVITCGVYKPDHMWIEAHPERDPKDAPTACPKFPPEQYKHVFKRVKSHKPPPYFPDDDSTMDTLEFWILKD